MQLIESIKLNLSDFHIDRVNQIDSFDYSRIAKKVNLEVHGLTSKYLMEGIENLKRYYVVALLDPLNEHAVSNFVDRFWHAHIIHTKEYMEFCNSVFGQYIHHKPLDLDDPKETSEVYTLYDYTNTIYTQMFKTVDEHWWPNSKTHNFGHVAGPAVCRHHFVTNDEIRGKALFARSAFMHEAA